MVFKTNYWLIRSKGSILQYFRPSLSYQLSLRSLFCLFLSGRFTLVVLYYLYKNSFYPKLLLTQVLTKLHTSRVLRLHLPNLLFGQLTKSKTKNIRIAITNGDNTIKSKYFILRGTYGAVQHSYVLCIFALTNKIWTFFLWYMKSPVDQ